MAVFFGSRILGAAVLEYLIEKDIVSLVVLPYKVRHWPTEPVRNMAIDNVIPTIYYKQSREKKIEDVISEHSSPLNICCNFDYILPKRLVESIIIINIHPGKLPEYRGPTPIEWQLHRGEPIIYLTAHRMDANIDTGPIIAVEPVNIRYSDEHIMEAIDILPRITASVPSLLDKVLMKGPYPLEHTSQDESKARYWPRWKK